MKYSLNIQCDDSFEFGILYLPNDNAVWQQKSYL